MSEQVSMSNKKSIYRVIFSNQDKIYEVYCSFVYQSDMYGFIELEDMLFGERTQLLVDPAEERLRNEFSGVKRSLVPMYSIIRIDEVEKGGAAKISDLKGNTVTSFPMPGPNPRK